MENGKEWLDLKLCDWGRSQITNKEELKKARALMKSFYITILLPLYVPVQNSRTWHFSVSNSELTCRIFFENIKDYHKRVNGVTSMRELLNEVSKYNAAMTPEKIDKMLAIMEQVKEEKNSGKRR